MTDGVRLPASAHNVWIYSAPFSPDHYYCMMFQADIDGITKFVEAFSGTPLKTFSRKPDPHRTLVAYFPKKEPWAIHKIKRGRYFQESPRGRGRLAVDLDRNIVYLIPMSSKKSGIY